MRSFDRELKNGDVFQNSFCNDTTVLTRYNVIIRLFRCSKKYKEITEISCFSPAELEGQQDKKKDEK